MIKILFGNGFMCEGHGLIDAKNRHLILVAPCINIHLYTSIKKGNSD